jgi:hypothetical protein
MYVFIHRQSFYSFLVTDSKTDKYILFLKLYLYFIPITLRRDSVVGIETSYGLDDRGVGVRVPVVSKMFSSPRRPDRL